MSNSFILYKGIIIILKILTLKIKTKNPFVILFKVNNNKLYSPPDAFTHVYKKGKYTLLSHIIIL